ncbi:helix-turn-helix transcriptional regulator [Saccharothrix coeruleofusca]|uniref:DNA-binding protein n=1 Tax=Saccharothrix coeruleofusca TaxID=33919 RepID=A0A918EF21_9PSEU|nr:helix-turn-helix transcriptional regulator [Saccharothrix coeruleofusca]MBP2341032.1 transcriptional regulator with XRE-family HTH domain [Saccharothrix coeruleofusca]GGP61599.1 DNA-binding protein [Saccharothrix coeruleofusca]
MSHELGEFLRSRRARISPEDVGLPGGGRRRVPGLRREELALLAGVSVDYYMRLEQGRTPAVSDAVLDAVARVLRLDGTERLHLRNLVRPAPRKRPAPQRLRPGMRRMLEMMGDMPVFVMGRRTDVLAWNRLAGALYSFEELPRSMHNAVCYTFLNPAARTFYRDWHRIAAETVAFLRLDAGRHPEDERLTALVEELSVKDEVFRKLWAQHSVLEKTHGVKRMRHPVVGDLDLNYETLVLADDPDITINTYAAPVGSPSEERLRLLASWAASIPAPASTTRGLPPSA